MNDDNVLIVVDMQNDFVTGSLANPDAQKIVPAVADFVKNWTGRIIFTIDTHEDNYLETQEGEKLPVKHCIRYSEGWLPVWAVRDAAKDKKIAFIRKDTFGVRDWEKAFDFVSPDKITIVGVCTDICVISNALALKAIYPETEIEVVKDLCAGTTPEMHQKALDVMKSCQVEIV